MEESITILNEIYKAGFTIKEKIKYPNDGVSFFFVNEKDSHALILDQDICNPPKDSKTLFSYDLITEKQNAYVKQYDMTIRLLIEDKELIERALEVMRGKERVHDDVKMGSSLDRADMVSVSPLEYQFEQCFSNVYGNKAIRYLEKEFSISDNEGHTFFLDYELETDKAKIAVEENGIHYHHPQEIREEKYRMQLHKQNTCALHHIKLYRFSTEDCQFTQRMEDDIKELFGANTDHFIEPGFKLNRHFKLYDHQEITLDELEECHRHQQNSVLIVLPTATGKSRIAEEDIYKWYQHDHNLKALILAPTAALIKDWQTRIEKDFSAMKDNVMIASYQYFSLHYENYDSDYFDYIVCDEAHHVVAPAWKRMIQYFNPQFLLGMTATDERLDKRKLEEVFKSYISNLSLIEAMEKHIIAMARVYRIETNLDLSEVRFNGKDYVNADLEERIRVDSRNELIPDVLNKYFGDSSLQGVIFCVNIQHTREMARILNRAGLSAAAFSSKEKNVDAIMKDFKNHKIRFLCACSMISEGWDYPELGILVMARPTLSKVLYLQQIGRGLRRTDAKKEVYVIDVVDEYAAMVKPCSMHSIFKMKQYVPFGEITRQYQVGDMVTVDGLVERVEKIIPVNIDSFDDEYGDYLNKEQLAREFFFTTATISSWIKKGKITPSVTLPFGNKKLELFSPEKVEEIRTQENIPVHNNETIYDDFFAFLGERDYTLSYKMPFLLAFLDHMNEIGDADIDEVLNDYICFYEDRLNRHLPVDRSTCPYNEEYLKNRKQVKRNMLTNPFEKFERKHFMYYSKNLNMISINHALLTKLTSEDFERIRKQMHDDLTDYYRDKGGL